MKIAVLAATFAFAMCASAEPNAWRGFGPPVRHAVAASDVVVIKDLNADGRPDIILSGTQVDQLGFFSVLVNRGNGVFEEQQIPTGFGEKIEDAADLNGDGIPDLLASNYWSNGISVYVSSGPLRFERRDFYGTATHGGPSRIVDYDGDGVPDVVSLSFGSGNPVRLHAFAGRGDGTLAPKISFDTSLANGASASTRFLNGALEVLVAEHSGNLGILRFTKTNVDVRRLSAGPGLDLSCLFADVNGDGIADVIDANDEGDLFVTLGTADGNFLERKRLEQQRHLSFPTKIRYGDVDGDGAGDLVVADFQATTLFVFRGDGAGNFDETPIAIDAGAPVNDFDLADVNGDGILDVVTANNDHTASVLINLGRAGRRRAARH